MKALIIIDMLNDFMTGALRNEARGGAIVPSIRRLLDHARTNEEWLVVYANDAHRADDREIALHGRHALAGTPGAAVIDALAPIGCEREFVCSKRYFGAFEGTDLEDILLDFDVADVVLTGQHTDGSVLHTAYGAFLADFDIHVALDAVCTRPSESGRDGGEWALETMHALYGASLTTSSALIGRPVLRTAASNPGIGRKPRG